MTNKNNLEELSLSYLVDVVKLNEGFSSKIYKDTKGIETIGYGRNLRDVGITEVEATLLLKNDIKNAALFVKSLPAFTKASPIWKLVLTDMTLNMGIEKLKKFKGMLGHLYNGNTFGALVELIDSNWYFEVGYRAKRAALAIANSESCWLSETSLKKIDEGIYNLIPELIKECERSYYVVPKRLYKANSDAFDKLAKKGK